MSDSERFPGTMRGAINRISAPYPEQSPERDRWILSQRPERNRLDAHKPYLFLVERERSAAGEIVSVATIFLTNRECPWRCLMCDLWKNTLTETVPPGAIPAQIDYALTELATGDGCEPLRQIKLYNSGSFFDPRAIPREDYPGIGRRVAGFARVIVESHPALLGDSCLRFRDLVAGKLEVAMGLETVHPEVLARLNKRMTVDQFARAAEFLRRNEIALRVFILLKPPFLNEGEALEWARRSVDFAFDCGAEVASLIPTRFGNGALEALAERGEFSPPKLSILEEAVAYGVSLQRGRVFADLWNLEQFSSCQQCFAGRRERLRELNHTQTVSQAIRCRQCGGD